MQSVGELYSHRTHRTHRSFLLRTVFPQNPQNAQKLLAENCIPTEPTHRSFLQRRVSHRYHGCAQIRRVWHPAVPMQPLTQPNFCEFCGFRGRTNATNHLCWSVQSVGELYSHRTHSQKFLAEKSLPQIAHGIVIIIN